MCNRYFHQIFLVKPLKDTKAEAVLHGLTGIVNESKRKPNKLWVD